VRQYLSLAQTPDLARSHRGFAFVLHLVCKHLGCAIGPQQRAFMAKIFARVVDVFSVFLFVPGSRVLPGLPVRDVSQFALTEGAIEHARCAKKSDVPSVQRR
jgi:hypothetical protein